MAPGPPLAVSGNSNPAHPLRLGSRKAALGTELDSAAGEGGIPVAEAVLGEEALSG